MDTTRRDSAICLDNSTIITIRDVNNSLNDTSIIDITQWTTKLLWTNTIMKYTTNDNSSVTINLGGNLDIEIIIDKLFSEISTVSVYCSVLRKWYPSNLPNYGKASIQLVLDTIDKISQCKSYLKARDYATQLALSIRKLNTCKSVCSTVTPNKTTGLCMFSLSDMQRINKFTAEGIVDAMDSLAHEFVNKDNNNFFADPDDIVVTCDGSMYIIKYTKYEKKTIDLLKEYYEKYISKWCYVNFTKPSDCNKLTTSIRYVIAASTIEDIFNITGLLLCNI